MSYIVNICNVIYENIENKWLMKLLLENNVWPCKRIFSLARRETRGSLELPTGKGLWHTNVK